MARHGKKYLEAAKLIDTAKSYPIEEAIEIVTNIKPSKIGIIFINTQYSVSIIIIIGYIVLK